MGEIESKKEDFKEKGILVLLLKVEMGSRSHRSLRELIKEMKEYDSIIIKLASLSSQRKPGLSKDIVENLQKRYQTYLIKKERGCR